MSSKSKKALLEGIKDVVGSKKIGCNTLKLTYADGREAIRYHATDVITRFPNGDVQLTSGGWRTVTTKLRFNDYTPYRVSTNKGIWFIKVGDKEVPFTDGMIITKKGEIKKVKEPELDKINAVKKSIAKYVKLLDNLETIPMPNGGDCWYCSMKDAKTGKSLGDATNNYDHLESHLEEGYIFGSIIFNALAEKGYRDPVLIMRMACKDLIKRALRKYLMRRLLPEVAN